MATKETVLITGVSGYIGAWCAHFALEEGYRVIGTVRNVNAKKCTFLRNAMAGESPDGKLSKLAADNLTLVEADLLAGDEAWKKLFQNPEYQVDHVLHTASPYFGRQPEDENKYIRPAVDGTTSVLKAAIEAGVKRVVVTSSVAAVSFPVQAKEYTPTDWTDLNAKGLTAYTKSKTLAEKAAWALIEEAKGSGSRTSLSTVNPFFVVGPTLYTPTDEAATAFESGEICMKIMTGQVPMVPNIKMGVSDVRDVARIHVLALAKPEAPGNRFIATEKTLWFKDIVEMFSNAMPALEIPTREAPGCLIRAFSLCNADMKSVKSGLNVVYEMDGSACTKILGLEFTDPTVTISDMMNDMVSLGIPATKQKSGCNIM